VVTQGLELRLVTGDIDQHDFVHIVADQDGVVRVGVIVVAVVRHIDTPDQVPVPVDQPDEGRHPALLDRNVRGDGLRAVGRDGAVVPGATVVEKDVAILGPEFVPDGIPFLLPKAGPDLARDEIEQPDTLGDQMPGPLVAVCRQRAVVGTELKVPDLMGIRKDIEPARAIEVCQRDASIFDQVVPVFEASIVRPPSHVHFFVATEGDVASVMAD
jgi:hypothetical protein